MKPSPNVRQSPNSAQNDTFVAPVGGEMRSEGSPAKRLKRRGERLKRKLRGEFGLNFRQL